MCVVFLFIDNFLFKFGKFYFPSNVANFDWAHTHTQFNHLKVNSKFIPNLETIYFFRIVHDLFKLAVKINVFLEFFLAMSILTLFFFRIFLFYFGKLGISILLLIFHHVTVVLFTHTLHLLTLDLKSLAFRVTLAGRSNCSSSSMLVNQKLNLFAK